MNAVIPSSMNRVYSNSGSVTKKRCIFGEPSFGGIIMMLANIT